MKLIVDKLPETAHECLFSAMGTGKPRCRHDSKLCPLQFGKACPHLTVAETPNVSEMMNPVSEPVEPKKRTSKRSTAKKAD